MNNYHYDQVYLTFDLLQDPSGTELSMLIPGLQLCIGNVATQPAIYLHVSKSNGLISYLYE